MNASGLVAETPRGARRRWPAVVALVLGAVLLGVLALQGCALVLGQRARASSLPIAQRAADARLATTLAPWIGSLKVARVTVEAEQRLEEGQVDAAYFLLLPYTSTVRGDDYFRSTYQRVLKQKWVLDSRKAHVQHGREAADGTLDPDDVLR